LDKLLKDFRARITPDHLRLLNKEVNMEELKSAIFCMHPEKAPGPDGLNPGFFQKNWELIKDDLLKELQKLISDEYLDPKINKSFIILIPKISHPESLQDFRPISLCNVAYRAFSKVLANRLKLVLHDIISPNQAAFISGRQITDNILAAHELLHSLRKKKGAEASAAMKIDMSKAFDRMEWSFVIQIMQKLGFPPNWCSWIYKCLATVTYRIIINGDTYEEIIPSRGLRQGDPLSPYLFILCSEMLSSMLAQAESNGRISGIKVRNGGTSINHLFFDDSLLFCKANRKDFMSLASILSQFSAISGQSINHCKSSIILRKSVNKS
jgi:hypothetical protein